MKAFGKVNNINDPITFINVEKPSISEDELLIKVEAIGVGIHDEYFHAPNVKYPFPIGIEASGIIEQTGSLVDSYNIGDRVAFVSMMQSKGGTWAEYCVVSMESLTLKIPNEMSFEQAAAIPVPANTAYKIMSAFNSEECKSIFIAGGAGAIGTILIQIAKERGMTVISSSSESNHAYTREIGADFVVDYHDSDWQSQILKKFPNGIDVGVGIHPGTPADLMPIIKNGGVVIAVSGDMPAQERGIQVKGVFNNIDVKPDLVKFINKVIEGEIKITIADVYPFEEAIVALNRVKSRHTRGKIVISLSK